MSESKQRLHGCDFDFDEEAEVLTITGWLKDGTPDEEGNIPKREVARLEISVDEIGESVSRKLTGYGLSKAFQDRTSNLSGDPAARVAEMESYADLWKSDKWTAGRKSGAAAISILLIRATAKVMEDLTGAPVSLEAAEAELQLLTSEQRAAWSKRDDVKAATAALRATAKRPEGAGTLAGMLG